jgi:hypothetical protein
MPFIAQKHTNQVQHSSGVARNDCHRGSCDNRHLDGYYRVRENSDRRAMSCGVRRHSRAERSLYVAPSLQSI